MAFAFTSVSRLYWHPLAWLSHEFDVEFFGASPAGHHLISLILHAVATGLLFLSLRRFGAHGVDAMAGALLWALHPLRVESFAWVAERKDVLCGAFFIATLLGYAWYAEKPSRRRLLTWTALGSLALMAKPVAVCLPVILLLLDFWPLRRTVALWPLLREKAPLLGISAVVSALTVYGQARSGSMSHLADVPFLVRLQNVPIDYVRYIWKSLCPVSLSCFYSYDKHPAVAAVLGCSLAFCAVSVLAVLQRKRRPWVLLAWFWFVFALLPNIGLLQAGRQSIADRFTYLAAVGVSFAVALPLGEWSGVNRVRRNAAVVSGCCVVAALAALTWRQIGFWHDSVRLFEHAISVEDGEYVRGLLGTVLAGKGQYAEAGANLSVALRLAPERAEHHINMANVLLRTGRLREAASHAAMAVRLAPNDISAANTMGLVLFRMGDPRGALGELDRAIRLGADPAPAAVLLNDMGVSVASRGQPAEAEPLLHRAVQLNPSLVQAHRNLVLALQDMGRRDQARAALRQAAEATGWRREYDDLGDGTTP
jgi:Flp pilus assembly protein TadD